MNGGFLPLRTMWFIIVEYFQAACSFSLTSIWISHWDLSSWSMIITQRAGLCKNLLVVLNTSWQAHILNPLLRTPSCVRSTSYITRPCSSPTFRSHGDVSPPCPNRRFPFLSRANIKHWEDFKSSCGRQTSNPIDLPQSDPTYIFVILLNHHKQLRASNFQMKQFAFSVEMKATSKGAEWGIHGTIQRHAHHLPLSLYVTCTVFLTRICCWRNSFLMCSCLWHGNSWMGIGQNCWRDDNISIRKWGSEFDKHAQSSVSQSSRFNGEYTSYLVAVHFKCWGYACGQRPKMHDLEGVSKIAQEA